MVNDNFLLLNLFRNRLSKLKGDTPGKIPESKAIEVLNFINASMANALKGYKFTYDKDVKPFIKQKTDEISEFLGYPFK